jgi:hypothetical protein
MKIKVVKGSEVFDKLTALMERCQECNEAAWVIGREFAATGILRPSRYRAGGLVGFGLPQKPEHWKQADQYGYYFPKVLKVNRALLDRIYALPYVDETAFNEVIGYKRQSFSSGSGIIMARTYGLTIGLEVGLIEMHDGIKYELLPGMEEVKNSEYMALMAELEKAKEEEVAQRKEKEVASA